MHLPHHGKKHRSYAHGHRDDDLVAGPAILDSGPGEADQEASHAADEQEAAYPVDALHLGLERSLRRIEPDENWYRDEADEAEGKLSGWIGGLATLPHYNSPPLNELTFM